MTSNPAAFDGVPCVRAPQVVYLGFDGRGEDGEMILNPVLGVFYDARWHRSNSVADEEQG